MSYTTVLNVTPGVGTEPIQEFRNAHGSAPYVWSIIYNKVFGTDNYWSNVGKLWPQYKNKDLPEYQRAVLLMTYDRVYIARKNFVRASNDIRLWCENFPAKENVINHWPAIVKIFASKNDYKAIGFHITSVTPNLFDGEWNEEKEEYGTIDWENETEEVYEILDKL